MWSRNVLSRLFLAHLVLFLLVSLFRELAIPSSWGVLGEPSRNVVVLRLVGSILPAQFLLIAIIAALWANTTDQRQAAGTILLVMPAWFHVLPDMSNQWIAASPVVHWFTPLAAFGALHVLRLLNWRPVWFSRTESLPVAKPWRYSMKDLLLFTTCVAVAFIVLAATGRTFGSAVFLGMLFGGVGVTVGIAAAWATLMPHRPLTPVLAIVALYTVLPGMASLGSHPAIEREGAPWRMVMYLTSWSLGLMLLIVGTLLVFRRCGLRLLPLETVADDSMEDPVVSDPAVVAT